MTSCSPNWIEQDHRVLNHPIPPKLGFKSGASPWATLKEAETVHMMRKGQAKYTRKSLPSHAEQFELRAG
ncbi:transposase [Microvirga sp. WGZ8]|uniref:Transposase n=1 Tax=Microvirga puerhi TaxID=2876078 RepID=A0ABS7VTX0_9HYPH|nr:transposase [Microvirga puerhi]